MGLIQLVSSFNQNYTNKLMLNAIAEKKNFEGFSSDWYMEIGNAICIFIFASAFLNNIMHVLQYITTGVRRIQDRRFKSNIKSEPEDPDDDTPNTKIKVQEDLEKLYTGNEFQGEKSYSRMMSTVFVILLFSSGMPILYFIGSIFFTITYLIEKFLLINFYRRSRTLTRVVPEFSMKTFKYAILFHLAIACVMFTDPEIYKVQKPDEDAF